LLSDWPNHGVFTRDVEQRGYIGVQSTSFDAPDDRFVTIVRDVPCGCGNGICQYDETHESCPVDCTCGNGVCDDGESATLCPADCSIAKWRATSTVSSVDAQGASDGVSEVASKVEIGTEATIEFGWDGSVATRSDSAENSTYVWGGSQIGSAWWLEVRLASGLSAVATPSSTNAETVVWKLEDQAWFDSTVERPEISGLVATPTYATCIVGGWDGTEPLVFGDTELPATLALGDFDYVFFACTIGFGATTFYFEGDVFTAFQSIP